MKRYHLMVGKKAKDFLPIIIETYPVAGVFSIGKSSLDHELVKTYELGVNTNNFSNPVELAESIIEELNQYRKLWQGKLLVSLIEGELVDNLAFYLVAQTLEVESYLISNNQIFVLSPLDINRISEDENAILEYLYKEKSVESLGKIVVALNWGDEKDVNEIARAAYAVNKLSKKEYVTRIKEGRAVKVVINDSGIQYFRLFKRKNS